MAEVFAAQLELAFFLGDVSDLRKLDQTAAVDRLVHHSVVLERNIDCYRMEATKRKKEGGK